MSSEGIDAVAEYVVKGILAAYEELTRLAGKHELAHAALGTTYPGSEHLNS